VADPKETLRANLEVLMKRAGMTKRTLAQKAEISENTVYLIFRGGNATGIDIVDRLAAVFKLPAWRLLRPGVLEKAPGPSETATDLARMFDALPVERQPRAYALMVQLLEFQNEGRREDTPLPSEAPTPAPEPAQARRLAQVRT